MMKKDNQLVCLGKDVLRGKKYNAIKIDGKTVKSSQFPHRLLDWFTEEYPSEILQLKINNGDDNYD